MDLNRIAQTLRRYWYIFVLALVGAVALGGFAYERTQPIYSSDSILFVTQSGFPWGRTLIQPLTPQGRNQQQSDRFADGGRFIELAGLYSQLAASDAVRARVVQDGGVNGTVTAEVVYNVGVSSATPLPLVRIRALANSPAGSVQLAQRWTDAFRSYILERQKEAKVPAEQVVLLEVVDQPSLARVATAKPRSLTRPIAIVLAVLMLALGLASVLDSARQRGTAPSSRPGDGASDGFLAEPDETEAETRLATR